MDPFSLIVAGNNNSRTELRMLLRPHLLNLSGVSWVLKRVSAIVFKQIAQKSHNFDILEKVKLRNSWIKLVLQTGLEPVTY